MTLVEAISITRGLLEGIEVRGHQNIRMLNTAMNNLDEIKKAVMIAREEPATDQTIPVNVRIVTHEDEVNVT